MRVVLADAEPPRSQELYDHRQRTVLSVSGHVLLRRRRGNHVRVFHYDGARRGLFGRPVLGVHRRGQRTEVKGFADVLNERILLWRLSAVHHGVRNHQTMEAHRAHQHVHSHSYHRHFVRGN